MTAERIVSPRGDGHVLDDEWSRIGKELKVSCWESLDEVSGQFGAVTFLDSFQYFNDPGATLGQWHVSCPQVVSGGLPIDEP